MLKGQAGERDSLRKVSPGDRDRRADCGDPPLDFGRDFHSTRQHLVFSRLIRHRVEAEFSLDVLQMQKSFIMLPAEQQEPSPQNGEFDAGADQFLWQGGCPSLDGYHLTPPGEREKCVLDQACGLREIAGCQSVGHGVVCQALLLIPGTRAPVEYW